MWDWEYKIRNDELHRDRVATTDRIVEMMDKTNVLLKEQLEALKKFNEAMRKDR